jgi:hypothetical protein
MDDRAVVDSRPGDIAIVPPGNDTLVVGDEPCIVIDFSGIEGISRDAGLNRANYELL